MFDEKNVPTMTISVADFGPALPNQPETWRDFFNQYRKPVLIRYKDHPKHVRVAMTHYTPDGVKVNMMSPFGDITLSFEASLPFPTTPFEGDCEIIVFLNIMP